MKQRTLDEMITYFNQQVDQMDIDRKYKMALLGMITAIGYQSKKQERTGYWISDVKGRTATLNEYGIVSCSARCSECGDWLTASDEYGCRGRFCPNCGAKMGDEHDDS